jgi:hypothetical protein
MGAVQITHFRKLKADIMKFSRIFCQSIVTEASAEIYKFAVKSLYDSYYSQYTPEYYKRTEQMLFNSYQHFILHNGNLYEGGIKILNNGIGYKAGMLVDDIVNKVWLDGSHGWRKDSFSLRDEMSYEEIITTPSPYEHLSEFAYSKKFKDKLIKDGLSIAKKSKYIYLKF